MLYTYISPAASSIPRPREAAHANSHNDLPLCAITILLGSLKKGRFRRLLRGLDRG
jgi:hypothetical protein